MRSLIILLVLGGCGAEDVVDPCSTEGDGLFAVDLHTTLVGTFLDTGDVDAPAVQLQDGGPECPFVSVPGVHTGHYPLALHHDRYAVAVTCGGGVVKVLARTTDDGPTLDASCLAPKTAGGGVTFFGHTSNTGQPYVIQTFVGNIASSKAGIADGQVFYMWRARGGSYDVVALGHTGDTDLTAPDDVRIIRGVVASAGQDLDVTPMTSPDWLALGPSVPVSIEAHSLAAMSYVTSNGTRAEIGFALSGNAPANAMLPTWPASARMAGELHIQTLEVDSADASRRRIVAREIAEPAAFDMALPPELEASVTAGVLGFSPLADATRYVFSCDAAKHSTSLDLSVAWLGAETTITPPVLAGVVYDCTMWGVTAHGATSPAETWRSVLTIPAT